MQVHEEAEETETPEDPFEFSRGTGALRIKKEQINPLGRIRKPLLSEGKNVLKGNKR